MNSILENALALTAPAAKASLGDGTTRRSALCDVADFVSGGSLGEMPCPEEAYERRREVVLQYSQFSQAWQCLGEH